MLGAEFTFALCFMVLALPGVSIRETACSSMAIGNKFLEMRRTPIANYIRNYPPGIRPPKMAEFVIHDLYKLLGLGHKKALYGGLADKEVFELTIITASMAGFYERQFTHFDSARTGSTEPSGGQRVYPEPFTKWQKRKQCCPVPTTE